VALLTAELTTYMRVETRTALVVDRSLHGELLRVNFNVSFPALACEYATLDISDAMGLKRLNLTKTVRKVPIEAESLARAGAVVDDVHRAEPKYDDEDDHPGEQYDDADFATPLSTANWDQHMRHYDIVVVNFFAPWCHWCQRLAPTWEAATEDIHGRYPEDDGRMRFAKVDCTVEVDLCRKNQITAFPSIRIFHHGSDDVEKQGQHEHLAYYGDRTREALNELADNLAPQAGPPHHLPHVAKTSKSPGCNFAGFLLVKKVPGTMHFAARAPGHSVDYLGMNMSHHVHHFFYGALPSARRRRALVDLHPLGLSDDWADKLRARSFMSPSAGATYEHYTQVVLTSIEPARSPAARSDAYEYTVQSHAYDAADHAAAKFTYRMSPIQIVVTEAPKPLYHFLTAVCAVIGGIFTVAGILDGAVHQVNKISKKMELGKAH
jgi:thiol-disulfide isomerase/thioredoxin